MGYGFIYITVNTLNGMRYIGQTYYREKMDPFYFGSGKAIKRAVKKNGREAFTRETIFEAFTKEDLDWAEIHFIKEFHAVESRSFYNISPGGRASLGFTGKKHSAERNKKLSEKMIGHKVSEHAREVCGRLAKIRMIGNIPGNSKSVVIHGMLYPSIAHAVRETGYTRTEINRMIKD